MQIKSIIGRVATSYRKRGFLDFVKVAIAYILNQWPFLLFCKGTAFYEWEQGQMRVMYIDTISASQAQDNVKGITKAYRKVSILMTFDYRKLGRLYGQSRMNKMLVKVAVDFEPDLIHLGKSELIYGSTIKEIKDKIDTCIIHFYGDFRWEPQQWVVDIGKYADCTLFYHKDASLIKKYEDLGLRTTGFWWVGTDTDIFYPRGGDKVCDVVFMANNPDFLEGHKLRRELIAAITKKGIKLYIFGNGWDYLSVVSNVHIHPFVTEEEFAEVCSVSKITLGVNSVNSVRMYASWRRTFNSMACGVFHLTAYFPGLEEVFENKKHLVWFKSIPEAIELIEYYITHEEERERIAEAGRKEVIAYHTWDARIEEMIRIYVQSSTTNSLKAWEKPWMTEWSQRRIDRTWRRNLKVRRKKDKAYRMIAELCTRYGNSVLDIGCGGGVQYASIREVSPETEYTGIDIIPKMIKFARKQFPKVKFELGDAADLPYSDGEFDVSIVRHVFEHHPLSNGNKILHESLRIAKNAALFLFFIEPKEMEEDIIEQKAGEFYENIYSKSWLLREIKNITNNRSSVEIISIPKTKNSPALSDQILYVVTK